MQRQLSWQLPEEDIPDSATIKDIEEEKISVIAKYRMNRFDVLRYNLNQMRVNIMKDALTSDIVPKATKACVAITVGVAMKSH